MNVHAISVYLRAFGQENILMPQDYLLCFYLTELKENKTLPNEVEKSFKNQMNTKDFSIHNLLL